MHRLASGAVSLDASVIIDFHLAGRLQLLGELFAGRLLLSDFVEDELADTTIQLSAGESIALSSTEEWDFFGDLRRARPGLGYGELGALTVARFHNAVALTNDRQALGPLGHGPVARGAGRCGRGMPRPYTLSLRPMRRLANRLILQYLFTQSILLPVREGSCWDV